MSNLYQNEHTQMVHKWTGFLQFHPFRWNVMAAHFFYSRITLVRISKSKVQISITTKSHLSEITSFCSSLPKKFDNFTKTCMILTQTWAIGLLLNSHTVKHANCYGSSHYFLKILFINHTHKNLTRWPWPLTLKINRVPDSLKD